MIILNRHITLLRRFDKMDGVNMKNYDPRATHLLGFYDGYSPKKIHCFRSSNTLKVEA
jgi:hypothetical protein